MCKSQHSTPSYECLTQVYVLLYSPFSITTGSTELKHHNVNITLFCICNSNHFRVVCFSFSLVIRHASDVPCLLNKCKATDFGLFFDTVHTSTCTVR